MEAAKEYLCKNLKLTIALEPNGTGDEMIHVTLTEPLSMLRGEVLYLVNRSTPASRRYHIQEAAVIAVRRLLSEAFRLGMINLKAIPGAYHGVSTSLNNSSGADEPDSESWTP